MGLLYGKCRLSGEREGEVQRLDGNGSAWRRQTEPVSWYKHRSSDNKEFLFLFQDRCEHEVRDVLQCNLWRWRGRVGLCLEEVLDGQSFGKRWRVVLKSVTRYTESTVASEKSTLLSSLGCTKEVWLLNRCFLFFFLWGKCPKCYDYYNARSVGVGKVLNPVWSKSKL